MPRNAGQGQRPLVRSDGVAGRTPQRPAGQPNGRQITSSDVPTGLPYGEGGALRSAIQQTPAPPGISDQAHAANQALASMPRPNITPLFAPTERPNEPVTQGSPAAGGTGPVHPMAMPQQPATNVSAILGQMAQATGSSALAALAARATALGQ